MIHESGLAECIYTIIHGLDLYISLYFDFRLLFWSFIVELLHVELACCPAID